jgi:hypothetical protein
LNTVYNARITLLATAFNNIGVGEILAGIIAPMVRGDVNAMASVVIWLLIGLDFSLARKCNPWKVAAVLNLETYWLVIAPALLFGLSAVAWAGLWITRQREKPDHPPAAMKPLR